MVSCSRFKLLFKSWIIIYLVIELTAESDKSPENFINPRNLGINEIQKMNIEPNSFSLSHRNSYSLNKNFEDLEYLLKATNKILM